MPAHPAPTQDHEEARILGPEWGHSFHIPTLSHPAWGASPTLLQSTEGGEVGEAGKSGCDRGGSSIQGTQCCQWTAVEILSGVEFWGVPGVSGSMTTVGSGVQLLPWKTQVPVLSTGLAQNKNVSWKPPIVLSSCLVLLTIVVIVTVIWLQRQCETSQVD